MSGTPSRPKLKERESSAKYGNLGNDGSPKKAKKFTHSGEFFSPGQVKNVLVQP